MDFERRLNQLRNRRTGIDLRAGNESLEVALAKGLVLDSSLESFERIKEPKSVKYALGAMAAVPKRSTEISIEEGLRVADSLIKTLAEQGEYAVAKIQGSVALDVHIEKYSDIDVLIINRDTLVVETPTLPQRSYIDPDDKRPTIDILKAIRSKSEVILPQNFPAAKVDCSKAKAIGVSGGSLRREVDIVPAMWFDNLAYQRSMLESDRGVRIYDKVKHEYIYNLPFMHIKKMQDRDDVYSGNLKCIVRLMKTLIADMDDESKAKTKKLTSYDLAAIGFSMDLKLRAPSYLRLTLVDRLRTYLLELMVNDDQRKAIKTPNGLSVVFEDDSKLEALITLWSEVYELSEDLFRELTPYAGKYNSSVLESKFVDFDSV